MKKIIIFLVFLWGINLNAQSYKTTTIPFPAETEEHLSASCAVAEKIIAVGDNATIIITNAGDTVFHKVNYIPEVAGINLGCIAKQSESIAWAAGTSRSLVKIEQINTDDPKATPFILSVIPNITTYFRAIGFNDGVGYLAGAYGGICKFNGIGWDILTPAWPDNAGLTIIDLYIQNRDSIWLIASDGSNSYLFSMKGLIITQQCKVIGSSSRIQRFVIDDAGFLYVRGPSGVYKFNKITKVITPHFPAAANTVIETVMAITTSKFFLSSLVGITDQFSVVENNVEDVLGNKSISSFCSDGLNSIYGFGYAGTIIKLDERTNGIADRQKDLALAFPNPFIDNITIDAVGEITLFDIYGQCVKTVIANGKTVIALSYLSSGNYILRVNGSTRKIIKM